MRFEPSLYVRVDDAARSRLPDKRSCVTTSQVKTFGNETVVMLIKLPVIGGVSATPMFVPSVWVMLAFAAVTWSAAGRFGDTSSLKLVLRSAIEVKVLPP